jgi:hypothetical protein
MLLTREEPLETTRMSRSKWCERGPRAQRPEQRAETHSITRDPMGFTIAATPPHNLVGGDEEQPGSDALGTAHGRGPPGRQSPLAGCLDSTPPRPPAADFAPTPRCQSCRSWLLAGSAAAFSFDSCGAAAAGQQAAAAGSQQAGHVTQSIRQAFGPMQAGSVLDLVLVRARSDCLCSAVLPSLRTDLRTCLRRSGLAACCCAPVICCVDAKILANWLGIPTGSAQGIL